jgi:hypothetical protein
MMSHKVKSVAMGRDAMKKNHVRIYSEIEEVFVSDIDEENVKLWWNGI